MCGVCVEAWVPDGGHLDWRGRHRPLEMLKARTHGRGARRPFAEARERNKPDQVRIAYDLHRVGITRHDHDNRSTQTQLCQGIVHRPDELAFARYDHMRVAGIAFGRHPGLAQKRMTRSTDADESVVEKKPCLQFWGICPDEPNRACSRNVLTPYSQQSSPSCDAPGYRFPLPHHGCSVPPRCFSVSY